METNWKDYFYFSRTQRRGIIILVSLILLFFIGGQIISNLPPKTVADHAEFEQEIAIFETNLNQLEEEKTKRLPKQEKLSSKPFPFNPNSITKEELLQLGLANKVVNTFLNYRSSGAKFYKKEDFKKVYGITKSDYERLAPYIDIPIKKQDTPKRIKKQKQKVLTPFAFNPNYATKEIFLQLGLSKKVTQTITNFRNKGGQFRTAKDFRKIYGLDSLDYLTLEPYIRIPQAVVVKDKKEPKEIPTSFDTDITIKVDINKSTIEDWKKLKGIGEVTAKRIISYRNKLGGFVSIAQIKEAYNIRDSVIDLNQKQLIVSPITNKIAINSISAAALNLHPYIKNREAHLIVNYRTNHGPYKSLEGLKEVKALKLEFINSISPYLSFE